MGACQPFEAETGPGVTLGLSAIVITLMRLRLRLRLRRRVQGIFPAALDRFFLSCVVSKSLVLALLGHEFLHQKDIEHGISPGILAEVGCCSVPAIDIFKIQVVVP